jgi:hypothetical protein
MRKERKDYYIKKLHNSNSEFEINVILKKFENEIQELQKSNFAQMFPIKAKHKLFGYVSILGIRTECDSNNNLMYLIKDDDGDYYWIYDYETEIYKP